MKGTRLWSFFLVSLARILLLGVQGGILMLPSLWWNAPLDGEEIVLEDAIKLLKERNYGARTALYEVKKSEGAYVQAGLLPNPNLSVNYTGLNFGRGFIYHTDNTLLSARVDQLFELGGKRGSRRMSAFYQWKAGEYQFMDLLREISIALTASYFQVLSDRASLEYLEEDLAYFERILKIQEQKMEAGFISTLDYTKLQMYRSELENVLLLAKGNDQRDLLEFRHYLGGGEYEPASTVADAVDLNFDEILEEALEKRDSLKALQDELSASEYQIKLLKAYSFPDLTLGVEYDSFGVQYKPGIGFGFSLNLPIFDRRQGDLMSAVYGREQVRELIRGEEEKIKKEMAQAYQDYATSKQVYQSYQEKKKMMDDLLEKSRKAYELGGLSTLEFLDTLRTYRSFMSSYIQSRYNYLRSYYALKLLVRYPYED